MILEIVGYCGQVILNYLYYAAVFALGYFISEKFYKPYHLWWFNKRNGAATLGFPLPIVGNALKLKRIADERDELNDDIPLVLKT